MNSLEKCQKVIDACVTFKGSVDLIEENEKLSKKIMSVLGEYYVLHQLLLNGFPNATHKGGHGSYDIEIKNPLRKIEVKTSTLKNDPRIFEGLIDVWGWTVETKSQAETWRNKSESRFNYLVTVALDKTWKHPIYYVFRENETVKNCEINYPLGKIPIYPSIFKRIQVFQDDSDFKIASSIEQKSINKRDFISPLDRAIFENEGQFKNNWERIRS